MKRYSSLLLTLSLLLSGVGTLAHQPPPAQAVTDLEWHPIAANLPAGDNVCLDPRQPNTALVSKATGTYATNWLSATQTLVNPRLITVCGHNGWIYSRPDDSPAGTAVWRFNSRDPQGQAIAHLPTITAEDGSDLIYALENDPGTATHHLWVSGDAGLTWTARDTPLRGPIQSMVVAATNAGIIYAVTVDPQQPGSYTIWASSDAGASWERRSEGTSDPNMPRARLSLRAVPGAFTPVTTFTLIIDNGNGGGMGAGDTVLVTTDGGRTFREVGFDRPAGNDSQVSLFYDRVALLRQRVGNRFGANAPLEQSTDSGATWTPVPLPPLPNPPPTPGPGLPTAPFHLDTVLAPGVLVVSGSDGLWASTDRSTWTHIADTPTGLGEPPISATPYLPLTLFRHLPANTSGPQIAWATFPTAVAGQAFVSPVAASQAPDTRYFAQTGHNLSAFFTAYWGDHGGLAQFGYPRTEAFPEVSATDGHIYWTQYYQRNRFEYHPENNDAYMVLLGLLGNDLTAARRAAGEAPFAPVPDPHQPSVTLFAPTGHTLRGPFATYWALHGGLALYGYPISEEFSEVRPTDGHSYTVQYFERNRFELHPEHAGTPYEVLLGLLGNTLIQQQGWEH